jgi:plasmid maintenance system killer protein
MYGNCHSGLDPESSLSVLDSRFLGNDDSGMHVKKCEIRYTSKVEIRFRDKQLDRLETDPKFDGGFSWTIVSKFRQRLQEIRAAPDERVFYQLRSMRFEKLKRHPTTSTFNAIE